jgi:hypothetical protein
MLKQDKPIHKKARLFLTWLSLYRITNAHNKRSGLQIPDQQTSFIWSALFRTPRSAGLDSDMKKSF